MVPAMNPSNETFIPGPVGQLQALIAVPDTIPAQPRVGIICHPNPTQQGTMLNKVVTTIHRAFELMGMITVRFNYRGVGKSDGSYGQVTGEIDDLRAVMAWVKRQWPDARITLAGFSFGSFIAASVANETPEIEQLLTVAPANDRQDFTRLTQVQCPWLVIATESDEIVSFEKVKPWLDQPPVPMTVKLISGASHFFHGRLIELRQLIIDQLE